MNIATKSVNLSEANQQFSRLIQQVEKEGIPVRILRRNKPVALLVPYNGENQTDKARQEAFDEMCTLHRQGLELGGLNVQRDALYDRK